MQNTCRGGITGEIWMKFAEFVCFEATRCELEATTRNDAVRELVTSLAGAGRLREEDAEKITRAIIRRENEASTGLGKGVAVPHIKLADVSAPVAAVGLSSEGIDFKSLDEQPVYSIILLLSPDDNTDNHLKAMECIFGHLQKDRFRSFLRQADTNEYIKDLLLEADEEPSL